MRNRKPDSPERIAPEPPPEVMATAAAFVASLGLDLGPVCSCNHVTKALLKNMLQDADPTSDVYEIGARLSLTMRDYWAVHFAKKLPDGVTECPASVSVKVFDDTGEAALG